MRKTGLWSVVAALLWYAGCARNGNAVASPAVLHPGDRILILAPHPDDEILGCAGIIQRAREMGLAIRIVFFTYGDGNEFSFLVYRKHPVVLPGAVELMGTVRRAEALAAGSYLGVGPDRITFLGYPDSRTLRIWYSRWGDRPPAVGLFTRATSVPYQDAFRFGAPYKGEEIVKDLQTILSEFEPTRIFLPHPADMHPDHKALYLFARVAAWNAGLKPEPAFLPYLVHYRGWPAQRDHGTVLLPPPSLAGDVRWQTFFLTPEERERKLAAVKKHRSQYIYDSGFFLRFDRPNELFGDFPEVVLAEAAHPIRIRPDGGPNHAGEREDGSLMTTSPGTFEKQYLSREHGDIVLSMRLSRPLGKETGISVFLFGYRRDCPFADMPKLHVRFGALRHQVSDRDRILSERMVGIQRQAHSITLRVPLSVLGNPQRILLASQIYLGAVPLDRMQWRIVTVRRPSDEKSGK